MNEFKEHLEKIYNGEKALSYSALSAFLKSPRHYYKYVMEKETTPAMEEGKRFHMAMLEPEKFKEKYFILDDTEKVNELIAGGSKSPRNTKDYREWKQKQLDLNAGKELIDLEEYETYMRMIEALNNHSVCKGLMNGEGENEKHVKYEDDFKMQCYIDRATKSYTVDLKKVADASFHKIKWDIERMNYDLQGVICSKSNKTSNHYLIYIDKGCNITVVLMNEEKLKTYEVKYNHALESFARCLEEDSWNMSYDFWQPMVVL
jgi:hypothetical protein